MYIFGGAEGSNRANSLLVFSIREWVLFLSSCGGGKLLALTRFIMFSRS